MANERESRGRDLTGHERMLIALRDNLYGGSWDEFLGDLKTRLSRRPYVFQLIDKLKEDIEAIERLQKYEKDTGVKLTEETERIDSEADDVKPRKRGKRQARPPGGKG
jgi:hypothetical protein